MSPWPTGCGQLTLIIRLEMIAVSKNNNCKVEVESENVKILWDFTVQSDWKIEAKRRKSSLLIRGGGC